MQHVIQRRNQSKQRILKILNLEDSGPICAFAIERSRGVFSEAASVPEQFTRGACFVPGSVGAEPIGRCDDGR